MYLKKYLSLLLAAILALSVTACGSEQDTAAPAETESAQTEEAAPAEDAVPAEETAPAEEQSDVENPGEDTIAESAVKDMSKEVSAPNGIVLIHAETPEGSTFLAAGEQTTAVALFVAEDEDTTIDHWEFNGKTMEAGDDITSIEFPLAEAGALVAVLRPIDKVEGINCHLQFLDEDGLAAGEEYTELNFEDDYENLVTGETCEGGTVSVCVTAEIPENQAVDYWLINGVEYDFGEGINSFYVRNLDEATVYEPVFKDVEVKEDTPAVTTTNTPHQHRLYMAYNTESHWYQCDCGYTEQIEEHQWAETSEPLEDTAGIRAIYYCTVCGYSYSENIIY